MNETEPGAGGQEVAQAIVEVPEEPSQVPRSPSQAIQVSRPLPPEVQRAVNAKKQKPRTASTLRAYRLDWKRFSQWCAKEGQVALPASEDTIVAHLLALSEYMMPASLERAYASIRVVHDAKGQTLQKQSGVYNALERIRRERAAAGALLVVRKRAFEAKHVIAAVEKLDLETLTGQRNRCVLAFGFALAQRRAQIADVKVEDVRSIDEGLEVTIRWSKTDQRGEGKIATVIRDGGPACAVGAVEAWLKASGIRSGPLLRRIHRSGSVDPRGLSGDGIAQIVKAAASSIGLDPDEYGGHSLRRGFVTSAAREGRDILAIMQQTGHESVKTVQGYIDEGVRVQRAAGRGLLASPEQAPPEPAQVHPTTGQPLQRRIAVKYLRGEEPLDLAWAHVQVRALRERSVDDTRIADVLTKVGVRRADGALGAQDVLRLGR